MSLTKQEKEILERRAKLQAELEQIEQKLDTSVGKLRSDVEQKVSETKTKFTPAYWIRKYPNYALGAAVALGFWVAPGRRRKVNYYENGNPPADRTAEPTVVKVREYGTGNMITSELKRMLMHKATTYIIDKIEDAIDQNLSKKAPEKAGEQNPIDQAQS